MDFKKIYLELIVDKANILVLNYKNHNGKYSYRFKHHILDSDSIQKLTDLLIDDIVFYAYSEDEIISKYNFDLSDLRGCAKHAFSERLAKRQDAKRDGLIGELMLDVLIQKLNSDAKKIFTRAKHVRQGDNNEITGYDAAFFVKKDDRIEMWLGQAKAGGLAYCKQGICDDLNDKYLDKYFCDSVRYMVDKSDNEPKDQVLLDVIKELNQFIVTANLSLLDREDLKQYKENGIFKILKGNAVTVIVPCLLMFDSNLYDDAIKFKSAIEDFSNQIINYFDTRSFSQTSGIQIEMLFILLPVKNLNTIKENLVNLKKVAQ